MNYDQGTPMPLLKTTGTVNGKRVRFAFSMRQGFTLVEALVALSILLIGVIGPLSVAARNVSNKTLARDTVTAGFLAQEAIEYVRQMRDSQSFSSPGSNWPTQTGFLKA